MNEINLNIDGFEEREIKIVSKNVFKAVELYIDGQLIKPKKGKYLLTDNSGNQVEAKFDMGLMVDPYNALKVNDKKYQIREPLKWYQYVFCGWPICMIFVGGGIGGGLGAAATYLNVHLMRTKMNGFFKVVLISGSSLLAVMVWLVLAVIINQKFGQ